MNNSSIYIALSIEMDRANDIKQIGVIREKEKMKKAVDGESMAFFLYERHYSQSSSFFDIVRQGSCVHCVTI